MEKNVLGLREIQKRDTELAAKGKARSATPYLLPCLRPEKCKVCSGRLPKKEFASMAEARRVERFQKRKS